MIFNTKKTEAGAIPCDIKKDSKTPFAMSKGKQAFTAPRAATNRADAGVGGSRVRLDPPEREHRRAPVAPCQPPLSCKSWLLLAVIIDGHCQRWHAHACGLSREPTPQPVLPLRRTHGLSLEPRSARNTIQGCGVCTIRGSSGCHSGKIREGHSVCSVFRPVPRASRA